MSILATDNKLISFGTDYSAGSGISIIDHTISIVPSAVGKTYSAGPNIDIYDVSGQPTISSKDWSNEISDASAGAVTQSTSYFNEWINGQYTGDISNITNNITALSGDLSSYYKKTETSSKEQINNALQYVSANAGKVYEGISPIVVNNDEKKISADTWALSAGNGISFTDDSANKVTRIDVTAQGGDEGVNSFVTENSATILDVNSSYKANSGTFLTAIPSDVATTGDVANLEQTISSTYYPKSNPSSFATESWVNGQGFLTAHQDISNKLDSSAFSSVSGDFLTTSFSIPESATWNDTSNVVQSNSAQWAGGASDTFYIYPGKTTDKEISENSGKDLKLYNSANNVFLDFAGKSTLSKYTMFSFKEITGTQANQNTVQHLRLRVYPNATSACKVFDTNTVNLLDINSTVSTAQTAYYDGDGNSLTQTHSELTALNSFVQSNSANWGGGSSTSVDNKVLFYNNYSYDPSNGSQNKDTFVSGATELYFEAAVDSQQSIPSEIEIYRDGHVIGRAHWSQVSSDGTYNYLTASYNNADGGTIQIQNYNGTNYSDFYVSANGVKTLVLYQDVYYCATDKEVKFNINGFNIVGQINGWLQGSITPLTSFTGGLTDFTAKGYKKYDTYITYKDSNDSYSYDVSAEFGGGVTGEFVSQSAFDELKASYDALSSLFATYSGQWLLPNEGV